MKNSIIISELTLEQFNDIIQGLQNQLTDIKQNFEPKVPTEYLTRTEVSEMLKCDISTIHNWTKKGKLIPYGIGNRVYYKRNEVETKLKPINGSSKV